MAVVIVDGQEIEIGDKERLNGIEVARRAGVDVPHYCWHPGLSVVASCRMCLVETGMRNAETGAITMMPKLSPACQTPAKDNTVFVTDSDKIRQARAFVEEQLLIDHPIDCPICDKAGECLLQDYHFEHGQSERRADIRPFTSKRREMGDTVTLFVDRCVMCTRCVRFTREISGDAELMVINRGSHEEIDVMPGFPLDNKMSGNVVDLCPVGALGDRDFLYKQRVWFMKRHPQICTGCSTGCNVWTEENQDHVYRLKPRENLEVNEWWMCDEGRYGFHHVHTDRRLTGPRKRREDGEYDNIEWSDAPKLVNDLLQQGGRIAGVLSPHLTVEEAYMLAKLLRQHDPDALLAMGPVPVVGEDETFKNGFVIHAEKVPNRRGVQQVLKHFTGRVLEFDAFVNEVAAGSFAGLWVTGGYRKDWLDAGAAERLAGAHWTIAQDMFPNPLWDQATFQLPGASFAEREGSYVNYQDRLQYAKWAVRPPAGAWVEGHLYWRLLGMSGMYAPRRLLTEIAGEIPYFHVAGEAFGEGGIDLKLNQLASVATEGAVKPA